MASSWKRLLPPELIEEILIRTPAESLNRFKSTCKQWYDLITDKRFMYNHLDRSPQRFIRIDDGQTVQIMDPVTGIHKDSPVPDVFRYPHSLLDSMVHCDGLMLCFGGYPIYDRERDVDLAVWNPVTSKIKWIEPLVCYSETDYFGIGYDNTCRHNYKILRFSGPLTFDDPEQCEIYEFKSDSWRTVDAKFDWDVDPQCKGVSVNGNMYWVTDAAPVYNQMQGFILSFDFTMETFKNLCVCPPFHETRQLACFSGDRLSLLLQDIQHGIEDVSTEIEVWVTNKLTDGVVSFTKYFNVTSPQLPLLQFHTDTARPGYSIGNHKNIMAWCEEKVKEDDDTWGACITFYQIDQGGIRKQIETGRHGYYFGDPIICSYVYVPSLIPVPD
ncbi:PREDICTED: putative F-box only protein 15 [Camelina sativa]|uniref:F-box only protein 15 n=1 Tax=Camelina sativa TaxID=90675 RepID=A0ABM0TWH5_CAMSA|nr:PREDICTED: putative F-box only protein 15 [Camelina sativa]